MMNNQIKKTFISQQLIKVLNPTFLWLQKACTYVEAKQRGFVSMTALPDESTPQMERTRQREEARRNPQLRAETSVTLI